MDYTDERLTEAAELVGIKGPAGNVPLDQLRRFLTVIDLLDDRDELRNERNATDRIQWRLGAVGSAGSPPQVGDMAFQLGEWSRWDGESWDPVVRIPHPCFTVPGDSPDPQADDPEVQAATNRLLQAIRDPDRAVADMEDEGEALAVTGDAGAMLGHLR